MQRPYDLCDLWTMATYAIGDIQGCFRTLKRLLKKIAFNPSKDKILLVGDLVNRGPQSIEVLRWAYDMDGSVQTVLGNHDIHLLAMALGAASMKRIRTLEPLLRTRDADKLMGWLRNRPIMLKEDNFVIVHAGVLPAWKIPQAEKRARKLEEIIQGENCTKFLDFYYQQQNANIWSNELSGFEKHCVALNSFIRMRMCRTASEMEFVFTGKPEEAPQGLTPWFKIKDRQHKGYTIIFGHWAAMSLRITPEIIALDSGCVWGQFLTAYRLEDGAIYVEPSAES